MSGVGGPLAGVKVVACSTAQAGTVPYMLMADLGADVIKIEVPGRGDLSRNAGERIGELSSFFETNNRGVRSLTPLKSSQLFKGFFEGTDSQEPVPTPIVYIPNLE